MIKNGNSYLLEQAIELENIAFYTKRMELSVQVETLLRKFSGMESLYLNKKKEWGIYLS